jgi:hypothetical protein
MLGGKLFGDDPGAVHVPVLFEALALKVADQSGDLFAGDLCDARLAHAFAQAGAHEEEREEELVAGEVRERAAEGGVVEPGFQLLAEPVFAKRDHVAASREPLATGDSAARESTPRISQSNAEPRS